MKEARFVVDSFLDLKIQNLRTTGHNSKFVRLITGMGNHSLNGNAVIKIHSIERLKHRNLKYNLSNDGCLKVSIHRESLLSNELLQIDS